MRGITMRKTLIILALVLLACASFAGTLLETAAVRSAEVERAISELGLPWRAGVPAILKEYAANGVSDLDSLIDKWNGTLELLEPIGAPDAQDFEVQATTRYNQLLSAMVNYDYCGDLFVPEGGFIQVHPTVRNQGAHGTCWAFATVASFESALLVQEDRLPGGWSYAPWEYQYDLYNLSEQFLAFHNVDDDIYINSLRDPLQSDVIIQDSNEDTGGWPIFSTYNCVRYGLPLDSDFPYIKYDRKNWIVWNPTNNYWEDNIIRSTKTIRIYGGSTLMSFLPYDEYVMAIKELLVNYGALVTSFEVPVDFSYYKEGVYVPSTATIRGGHAVTLVGWLDMDGLKAAFPDLINPQATSITIEDPFIEEQLFDLDEYKWEATEFWVIKNSWSEDWGWKGYYVVPKISEELYNFLIEEFYALPKWMIECDDMYVPLFEESYETSEDIDFNGDGIVDRADFELLLANMFTTSEKYDISIPKDGRVDQEDASRFFVIFNSMLD